MYLCIWQGLFFVTLGLLIGKPSSQRAVGKDWLKQEKEKARQDVSAYCNNPKFEFLKCETDPQMQGAWKTAGGTFGMGVFAYIENNPSLYGVEIYQNLRLSNRTGTLRPVFTKTHRIDPAQETHIPVFLKVAQRGTAELSEKSSYDLSVPYFEKESRRAREFARKKFGPEYYDVRVKDRNMLHSIHEGAYLVRQVHGVSATDLVNEVSLSVIKSLETRLQDVMGYYEAERTSGASTNYPLTKLEVEKLVVESWLWAKHIINLFDATFEFTRRMWDKGLRHCDAHLGNYMFTSEVITDEQEATLLIRLGLAFAPQLAGTGVLLHNATIATPITVYRLDAGMITAIDLAYAFDMSYLLSTQQELLNPCLVYRASRNEDSFELYRSMQFADKTFAKITSSWDKIKTTASERYLYWPEFSHTLSDFLSQINASIKLIQDHFTTFADRLVASNPEWRSCVKNNEEFRIFQRTHGGPLSRNRFPMQATHMCSTLSEERGLAKATQFLAEEDHILCSNVFQQIPQFAPVLCEKVHVATKANNRLGLGMKRRRHQIPLQAMEKAFLSPLNIASPMYA